MRPGKFATVLFVFALLILVSCSKRDDCFIADSVEKIKEIHINDTIYFVYLRISGFNEKEYFYELYDIAPKFNDCVKTEAKAISNLHVDTSEGKPITLMIKNEKLSLLFSKKNEATAVDLKEIFIETNNRQPFY